MKVVLYMAMSVNGFIAKENSETPWSADEWKSFSRFVGKAKNIVIGRKTYDLMEQSGDFQKIGNPFTIVLTRKAAKRDDGPSFVHSPKEALDLLEMKGFKYALIAGGGEVNASFMKAGLIDEIYLDVEPLLFGKGITLFANENINVKLEFLGIKKISGNTRQLHYKVVK